ncbi:MAG TPA: hypothetical protein DEB39_12375 [Planctomycetaceae bacterium]|nr:hypothetical protein [Planctomycetaceae bacterium]
MRIIRAAGDCLREDYHAVYGIDAVIPKDGVVFQGAAKRRKTIQETTRSQSKNEQIGHDCAFRVLDVLRDIHETIQHTGELFCTTPMV